MSTIRGDQHRPRFQPSESAASIHTPKHAEGAAHAAKSEKTASSGKAAATDRAVTAKEPQASHEAKALASAKEKLVSGDSTAKFASQLKDFGSFATKLSKGFGDVGQFLSKLNGALDKTLKGAQDGMQLAEKLGGFENQLKGTFDALANLVKTGMQILETFKGLQSGGAAPPAGQPAPATTAPAAGGAAPPAAPPAGTPAGAAAPAGTPAGAAAPAAPPAGTPAGAPTTAGAPAAAPPAGQSPAAAPAQGKMPIKEVDWKPTTHETHTLDQGGGFTTQTDLRTSGGTTTQMKEVIEKKTITEMQAVEKVRDVPGKKETGKLEFGNAIPTPGQEHNVSPADVSKAGKMLDKFSVDDLRQPGVKINIDAFASHRGDSGGYDNKALTDRRSVYTRDAMAKALEQKGLSKDEINKILPSEQELKTKNSHGSSKATEPEKASIEKQQVDRKTDITIEVPGRKETYKENVPVTKEIEVKKQVPVETQKPMAVVADFQAGGPGMNAGASCEFKQDANGNYHITVNGGSNTNMDELLKSYGVSTGSLGPWAPPYNNFFAGALQGNPSAAAFQAPLQQFGQAIRNDVLSRPDLAGPTKKGVEAFAGRVDNAANHAMGDLNAIIASYSSPSGGPGGRGPIGSQLP